MLCFLHSFPVLASGRGDQATCDSSCSAAAAMLMLPAYIQAAALLASKSVDRRKGLLYLANDLDMARAWA